MKKLLEIIYGREYDLRERIFRVVILAGGLLAALSIVECILLMGVGMVLVLLLLLLAVMITELLITFKFHNIEFAAVLVGFLIILLIFPAMFFLCGGLEGGSVLWFALGLFYAFLMFSGKRLAFFLSLSILVDIVTYVVGYCHPEYIVPMDSREVIYLDSLFSMLCVGLAGGIILKVQMRIFSIERSVALDQKKELECISDSKNSFFASMSHELRTPINTIIGLNEMILRQSGEQETVEYARNVQNASKMLLNLINDILDLSQMEMKKMEIVPLEYKTVDLFHDLVDMMQVRMQEKNLEFQVDIDEKLPSVLLGDRKRISQVLLNLLSNAAKYTDAGSVTFSAHGEPVNGDTIHLKVSVSDTGIGIRKENLEHLYDSFVRADRQKNLRVEGSGLGLSIAKQLVDLMGGEISVDSIYRKGSVFTVILTQKIVDRAPIGSVEFVSGRREDVAEYHQSFEAPEARILIVDDNEMNTLVESRLLEATKLQIDIAGSGAACLEMTRKKYYHVILMDYRMGEMDGLETLKQLRKQENGLCRESAVIALSAHSQSEVGRVLLREGFDGYLEKPVQGEFLEAEVLRFIPEDMIEYRLLSKEPETGRTVRKVESRRRRKVRITTDCLGDLPEDLTEKYEISLMYLFVRTARGRFADTWEITSDDLHQYMTDSTSDVAPDGATVREYEEFFADMLTEAEQIIHISISRNVGMSYETAATAAQGFDHVHVIDSEQISCGQALVALYAGRLAQEGLDVGEIVEKVEKIRGRIETRFLLPSAEIYFRRGYIEKTVARLCEIFHLYPELKVSQGRLVMMGTRAGKREGAWKRFICLHLLHKKKISTDILFVSHAGCSVEQQEFISREVLRHVPFQKVIMQRASVSTACSTGIGTFGFAYYRNVNERNL